MEKRRANLLIGLALFLLWLATLALPTANWGVPERPVAPEPGLGLLLLGWLGILGMQFAWFANLLFLIFLPWAARARQVPPVLFTVAGFMTALLGLSALSWTEVITDTGKRSVVVGPGYYVWIAVMAVTGVWLFVRAASDPRGR